MKPAELSVPASIAVDQLVWSIAEKLNDSLTDMPLPDKVEAINRIREALHRHSPFKSEPVDFVRWIKAEHVTANDYNPNSVAPPEMRLLEHSIAEDGYTQPIVSFSREGVYEVVDGFHRHRVGKESPIIQARVYGYLPAVVINSERHDLSDRMASTIRHNRARGKHKVESMSDIVVELKRRFWSDEKIATELGMEADEVLRLQQITGLSTVFADREFSEAWEAESFTDMEEIDEASVSPLPEVRGIPDADVEASSAYREAELRGQISFLDDEPQVV